MSVKKNKVGNIVLNAVFLLELGSEQEWMNRIPRDLPKEIRVGETWIWVDKNGNVFETGRDFAAAEKMKSFPCKVFRLISVADALLAFDKEGK